MSACRPLGCDISVAEEILSAGTWLGPIELGLLATVGVSTICCYKLPTVGVMSTGNEVGPRCIHPFLFRAFSAEIMVEHLLLEHIGMEDFQSTGVQLFKTLVFGSIKVVMEIVFE